MTRPAVALVVALAAAAVALLASPAAAHTALTSSDPAAGATLDTAPATISLTFSGTIRGDGASVTVTDSAGASATTGTPAAVDGTLTVPVSGLTGGAHQVAWAVLAADGHRITGEYSFTVTAPPSPAPTTAAPATSPAQATDGPAQAAASPTPTERFEPAAPDDDGGAGGWVVLGVLAAVLLLAAGAAVQLVRRRRTPR